MPMVRWQTVCSCCGRGGATTLYPPGKQPHYNPYPVGGKCPSTPDGKHRPKWVKV